MPKVVNLKPVQLKKKNVFERDDTQGGVDMNDDFEFPAMDLGVARNKGYAFVFVCLLSVYVVYVCE